MYIHPFLAGVLMTILIEVGVIIAAAIYANKKDKEDNKHGKDRIE